MLSFKPTFSVSSFTFIKKLFSSCSLSAILLQKGFKVHQGFQDYFCQCSNPTTGHCWPTPLPETPGHWGASLAQSLVGSLLLSPGCWCMQGFVVLPRVCFPNPVEVLWSNPTGLRSQISASKILYKFKNNIIKKEKLKLILWGHHHPNSKTRQRCHKKRKLQDNITDEHRCKNP